MTSRPLPTENFRAYRESLKKKLLLKPRDFLATIHLFLCIILTCGFRRQLFESLSLYVVSCPRPAKLWLADLTCPQRNCLSAFFPPYTAYCPKSLLFPHSAIIWQLLFLSAVLKTKPPKDLNQNVSVLEKEEISFWIRDLDISLRYVC